MNETVQEIDQEPAPKRDFEADARTMGWVPADEFRGDPAKHKGAQEFVELGEQKTPLLLKNIERLTGKVQELEKGVAYQATHHAKALKEQNDRIRQEYEGKMQEAVKDGDEDAYLAAKKGRDDVKDPEPAPAPAPTPPAVTDFIDANSWYRNDRAMTMFADAESARLMAEFPDLTIEQNLVRTKASVEAEFPHKFGNARRNDAAAVAGARKPGKPSGRGFADLPEEAKTACEMFRKQGIFAGTDGKPATRKEAEEQYLSTYEWNK